MEEENKKEVLCMHIPCPWPSPMCMVLDFLFPEDREFLSKAFQES